MVRGRCMRERSTARVLVSVQALAQAQVRIRRHPRALAKVWVRRDSQDLHLDDVGDLILRQHHIT